MTMREPREQPISPHLVEMLITLDEFLRSRDLPVSELFAQFFAARGSKHPRFDAYNFIDQFSFTTLRHRPREVQ